MLDLKTTAKKTMTMTESDGTCSGGSGAAQADAEGAPDATPDLKVAAKRPTIAIGLGSSSPPRKRFYATWTCQGP
jgi:hypothetical protein